MSQDEHDSFFYYFTTQKRMPFVYGYSFNDKISTEYTSTFSVWAYSHERSLYHVIKQFFRVMGKILSFIR